MKRKKNSKPSTFFTMNANPKGASIGNFVNNMKGMPKAFQEVGSAIKKGMTATKRRKGKK